MRRRSARMVASLLCAGAAGCTVGPNFQRPPPPSSAVYAPGQPPAEVSAVQGVAGGQAQRLVQDRMVDAQWWRAFGSPGLDAMVDEALKANPDLQSAEAALRQAQALMKAQAGAQLPTADLSYQVQRAQNSAAIAPVLADNSNLYTLHTAQLTVAYALDVFGGLRRQTEAATAQAEAARLQYAAARSVLIANVAAAAIQSAALARQVQAARLTAEDVRQALALLRKRAELGEIAQIDVAAQETLLAQAEQALPPLLKALAQQQSALAVLLGRESGQGAPAPLDLDALTLPAELPVSSPAALVRQRPDVAAAEANLHAASAGVGVAVAARLPSFTLGAAAGGASTQLRDLLASGDTFWTLSAGVTQPIFRGGELKARQQAAQAAFDGAKAQYRSTVLNALKNVADSLDALQRDDDVLQAVAAAEAAGRRSLALARASRDMGEVGPLEMLGAQQTYDQTRSALAQASAARFADTAALYQALGAGA